MANIVRIEDSTWEKVLEALSRNQVLNRFYKKPRYEMLAIMRLWSHQSSKDIAKLFLLTESAKFSERDIFIQSLEEARVFAILMVLGRSMKCWVETDASTGKARALESGIRLKDMSDQNSQGISQSVFEDSLAEFLKPVAHLLADPKITEIMINGPDEIFVEIKGKIHKTEAKFENEAALLAAVRNVSQFVGKPISTTDPILDARLPNGSRVCAVIPPCSKRGSTMAIRKFSVEKLGLKDLITFGAMSHDMARFLDIATILKRNTLVSGGTGSGKTTLLNVLGSRIPGNERVLIIEDTSELQIKSNHVVRFETKHKDFEGKGEVTIRDLVKASLRLRPDRIIVGEVRGAEALDLVQAMNTGHDGSMGTLHANNPPQGMNRLETLCMLGDTGVPALVIRAQVADAIHLIVQANRLRDGSRKITAISECTGLDEKGNYVLQNLFVFQQTGVTPEGRIQGTHVATGILPSFKHDIETSGIPFNMGMFTANKKAA